MPIVRRAILLIAHAAVRVAGEAAAAAADAAQMRAPKKVARMKLAKVNGRAALRVRTAPMTADLKTIWAATIWQVLSKAIPMKATTVTRPWRAPERLAALHCNEPFPHGTKRLAISSIRICKPARSDHAVPETAAVGVAADGASSSTFLPQKRSILALIASRIG